MMNWLTLIPLATAILLVGASAPTHAQQPEKKEGTVFDLDPKKKTVELGWEVIEFEQAGGTKAQPIEIPKAFRVEKAKYPLSEKLVVRFTKAPTFVSANGKEREANGSEYTAYRGNGNYPGFKASPDAVLKNRKVTLVFKKDEVVMILVNGSETIKLPQK
jgi:hypothetical protein